MRQTTHVKIAITMDDGSLHVMQFFTRAPWIEKPFGAVVEGDGTFTREPTTENIEDELRRTYENKPEQPVSYKIIADADVPTDRQFRDAWVFDEQAKSITHDLGKAKAICLRRIRAVRDSKLQSLDDEWMRATGRGDAPEAAKIEGKRQRLRDLPTTLGVETMTRIDELKTAEASLDDESVKAPVARARQRP